MFDDLIPRTLIFSLNGREIECPMLPVRFFGRYLDVLEQSAEKICADTLTDGRIKLREIILTVWPKRDAELLYHFDYHGMTQLARDLFFGPDQSIRSKQSYGSGNPEEPDLDLIAGRIMSIFPSYDLDRVMSMTLPQFFAMGCLAMRMQADQSLQVMIPAVAAIQGASITDAEKATLALTMKTVYDAITTNLEYLGSECPHMDTYAKLPKLIRFLPEAGEATGGEQEGGE